MNAPITESFAINQVGEPDIVVDGHQRFVGEKDFLAYRAWARSEIEVLTAALTQCAAELGSLHHADGCVEHAKAHSAGYRMAHDVLDASGNREIMTPVTDEELKIAEAAVITEWDVMRNELRAPHISWPVSPTNWRILRAGWTAIAAHRAGR